MSQKYKKWRPSRTDSGDDAACAAATTTRQLRAHESNIVENFGCVRNDTCVDAAAVDGANKSNTDDNDDDTK
jgi:hypothetical protein